jgi:diguanylate cyclase (GGDEF)-like protein
VITPARRVWGLCVVLAVAAAAVVYRSHLIPAPVPLSSPLAWLGVTLGFAAAEIWVVHLQFRRESNTVSLSEIPLTLGLIFLAPPGLILAQLLGTIPVLVLHRRQSLLKVVFNAVQLTFCTGVGVLVFHSLVGSAEPLGPAGWSAALAASGTAAVLSVFTVSAAIGLTEGRLSLGKVGPVIAFSIGEACVNTSLALVGAVTMSRDSRAGILLLMPAATLYAAYRAYTRERQKTERIEFLYNSGRTLAGAPAGESAIVELLGDALRMFRAEVAQVSVWPSAGSPLITRTTVRADGPAEVDEATESPEDDRLLEEVMASESGMVIDRRLAGHDQAAFLAHHGLSDAVITSLRADNRVVGTILVGKRTEDVVGFDQEHLNLLETLAAQVGAAVENSRLERVLQHQAFHDSLTNMANRAMLNRRVETALEKPDDLVAVLLIDIDDFKVINDTMGHSVGDQLLVGVAERLATAVRTTDTAARFGGDEFAVLVENMYSTGDAIAAAERVLAAFREPFNLTGQPVRVSASIGIATNNDGLLDPGALMLQADVAMYAAKASEPGSYRLFEASMQDEVAERHALREDLRRALERGELVNHYQPLLALEGHAVLGMEALVRWHHPDRGLIAPGYFIRLAEESGLIVQLGGWVLREACRQLVEWQRLRPAWPLGVSVNLSAVQLRQDGFVDEVVKILKETGLDSSSLTLEITESTFMDDARTAIARLRELRGLGIRLELDDFGTGFSSLSLLRDLPLDGLKIDKSFVDGIRAESDRPVFLQAIVRMAQALDLEMVGEGVEEEHQAEALRAIGVQRGQGYLFSRPLPAEDMGAYLRRSVSGADAEDAAVVPMPARRRSD